MESEKLKQEVKALLNQTLADLKYLAQFETMGSQVAFNQQVLITSFLEKLEKPEPVKMKKAKLNPRLYLRGL